MFKYLSLAFSFSILISCQPSNEDLQHKYRQAHKIQQEALDISKRVDANMNQTKYLIGELAKSGFQNPATIDIMNRFTIVEENYRNWKKTISGIPGYATSPEDAKSKKFPSPKEVVNTQQSSLNMIKAVQIEIKAVYQLADQ